MTAKIVINGEKQEKLIKRSINSCLKQTYKKIQIIVVYNSLKNINSIKKIYKKKVYFLKRPLRSAIIIIGNGNYRRK